MATWYPNASKVQDFTSRYSGSPIKPNCVVLHSTEGTSWPSYEGGATAPHFTIMPDFNKKTVYVRQHYPISMSSRALRNESGGVETNTLNCVQIEMVGTCDPGSHRRWGGTHWYMPETPDWLLEALVPFFKWLEANCNGLKIKDGAPRGWGAYPSSYGASHYRMTFKEWGNCYGIVGHQHVPENTHGDPGNFPIKRLIDAIVAGPKPSTDKMRPASYFLGAKGSHVLWLKERLRVHGFSKGVALTSTVFGQGAKAAIIAFQKAQGWTGADADGLPGNETLKRLAAPKVKGSQK